MAPTRRCWNFDQETGSPLPPHYACPRAHCPFIHPDSPRWNTTPKSHPKHRPRERSPVASSSSRNPVHDRPTSSSSMKQGANSRWGSGDWSSRSKGRPVSPDAYGSTNKRSGSGVKESSSNVASLWSSSENTWGAPPSNLAWGEPSGSTEGEVTNTQYGGWGSGGGLPSSSMAGWGDYVKSQTKPRTFSPPRPPPKEPSLPPPPPSMPRVPPPSMPRVPSPPPPPPLAQLGKSSLNSFDPPGDGTHSSIDSQQNHAKESLPRKGNESPVGTTTVSGPDPHKVYKKRISLLSEAIMIRSDYIQVTRALEARRKMQNTQKFTHISENVQSKLDSFTQECDEKRQELKLKLDDLLFQLVESERWPNGVTETKASNTNEASFQQLSEIQARLNRLESMIRDSEAEANRPKSQSADEVEPQSSLGTKRHRESISDGRTESHKEIITRVEQLEARTAEIDNQAMQQSDNVIEIVDARIEEKLEGLRLRGPASRDVEMADGGSDPQPSSNADADDVRDLVMRLTSDLDVFADETATLITKQADIVGDIQQLQAENLALKTQLAEQESSNRALQTAVGHDTRRLEALLAAFKIMRDSRTAAPPLDAPPLEAMRKQVLDDVLKDVNPALLALRKHCEAAMVAAREETLTQVVAKMGRTVELVNIIYGYFSRSWQGKDGSSPSG